MKQKKRLFSTGRYTHTHKIGSKYLRDVFWALLSWPSEVFYRSLLGNSLCLLCVLHFAMQRKAFHCIKVDFHCRVIFTGVRPKILRS